jgi:hypothetical protein
VTAARIDAASATQAELLPVPNDKDQWPDPPTVRRVNEVLGLSQDDVRAFFGGADVRAAI